MSGSKASSASIGSFDQSAISYWFGTSHEDFIIEGQNYLHDTTSTLLGPGRSQVPGLDAMTEPDERTPVVIHESGSKLKNDTETVKEDKVKETGEEAGMSSSSED